MTVGNLRRLPADTRNHEVHQAKRPWGHQHTVQWPLTIRSGCVGATAGSRSPDDHTATGRARQEGLDLEEIEVAGWEEPTPRWWHAAILREH
jgi:hypothetical protein